MPELPEVETVRIGLQRLLPNLQIKSVTFDWPKGFPNSQELIDKYLIGAKIIKVDRRGKVIIIDLSSDYSLLIHLKMTGQLVYDDGNTHFGAGHPNDSLVSQLPNRSTRVIFTFVGGSKLYFNDQRKFGWIKLEPTKDLYTNNVFLQKLGPEPLEDSYTFEQFNSALQKRKKSAIKAAILDQTVLAGVGNIYADESLFMARIHPASKVQDISTIKLKRLYNAIREVMKLSIAQGGSSDRNYVDAEGKKGSYLKFAKVFRLNGKPCPNCGKPIQKTRVAGRGTHYCAYCQKLPKK